MHILIIPSWYPHFKGDIGGSFFREQAIALKKNGHSVGVIYPQLRSILNIKGLFFQPYGCLVEYDEGVNTLRWHSINPYPKLPNLARKHWINRGLKLFEEYVKAYGKPNIIHVHSLLNAGFLAWEIYKKYNIPYIITEHSSAFARNLIDVNVIDSLKPIVADAKQNIAVSEIFSKYLENKFLSSTWKYIPNIVNDDFFQKESDKIFETQDNIRIISICYLTKNKNTELLIKAFAQVLPHYANEKIELVIGGNGEERTNLEDLVQELNLEKYVTFLGSLSRNQVKDEIQKSSLFVISSKYETFGVVVVEALALGKPVVSTRCGGPESIINSNVGVLVENNSIFSLAQGIKHVCMHLRDYNSKEIKEYCFNNFSEIKVIEKLNEIYIEHGKIDE